MLSKMYLLSAFLISTLTQASVSDSGGKIYKWSANPWFLENTETVTYCIRLDENFGGTISSYQTIIRSVLQSWNEVFADAKESSLYRDYLQPYGNIKVGTQKFVESCSGDSDISFMLGSLTEDQREHFQNPREFVGAAIRTEYDVEEMKSKGFIYIAPLKGELKPRIAGLPDLTWDYSDYRYFIAVLNHEIGHVFGLSHGAGDFMNANFPEKMVTQLFERILAGTDEEEVPTMIFGPWMLSYLNDFDKIDTFGCTPDPIVTESFSNYLHPTDKCVRLKVEGGSIAFYTSPWTRNGQKNWVKRTQTKVGTASANTSPLVTVFLPSEQKVFHRSTHGEAHAQKSLFEAEWVTTYAEHIGEMKFLDKGKTAPYIFNFKRELTNSRSFFHSGAQYCIRKHSDRSI